MQRGKLALFVLVAGVATVLTMTWLLRRNAAVLTAESDCVGCRIPGDTMIRFELARTREEVLALLQPADQPCGRCVRKAFDAQNRVDFAFMASYSALAAAVALFVASPALADPPGRRRDAARLLGALGLAAALAMLVGDAVENLQLFRLTGDHPDFDAALRILVPATRLKWAALPASMLIVGALYALSYVRRPLRLPVALVIPYLLAAAAGAQAVATGEPARYAVLFNGLALAWGGTLLHAAAFLAGWAFRGQRGSAA